MPGPILVPQVQLGIGADFRFIKLALLSGGSTNMLYAGHSSVAVTLDSACKAIPV